ncbi:MAG: DUF1045 domain-containing protein [Pseudomonadota bacterium]
MERYSRYAVYYTPPEGAFADQLAAWLGWDGARGAPVANPDIDSVDVTAITETPRKYGAHGTLKPPMRLADGHSAEDLRAATARLAASLAPVTVERLEIAPLGRFLALVPTGDVTGLADLAARVVMELDPMRAAPSEAELAKRRAAQLSPAQEAHLDRWGYPYVLDQFRFHITLTGRLDKPTLAAAEAALARHLSPPAPFVIDALSLCGERTVDGRFELIERMPLTAG